ncbi:unnamed protein product [Phyllotreta striolata]|uniref:CLIP domain-containing serine protease n=1 Tax=Phyllotreta striolata TaxID=444603 RepID=A0A9P0DL40_PHYSR|nr:unnamed protein product [Phyllotreta striolata]
MRRDVGLSVLVIAAVLSNFGINAQRGRSCETPNGERATCVSIYSCRTLLDVIRSSDAMQVRFLQNSQCGYDREPLVCCGTANTYASQSGRRVFGNSESSSNGNNNFRINPSIPDRESCGHDFSERIFGGRSTAINEFPWMALLQYVSSNGNRRWSCAGTLINKRYVLTAAHCVTGDILVKIGRLVNVRLGEFNTDSARDCQGGLCNNPEDISVEEIIPHSGYNNNNQNRYNDIALVRLSRPVVYTQFIQPICLPRLHEAAEYGDRVTVAGWGSTEYAKRSSVKLKVEIPIAERSTCTKEFSSAGINLRSSQICAGGEKGKDSCTGDSGGPLMKVAKDDSSVWYQEGIVSFGAKCGTEGWPAIYTRVESFLGWIHSTVRD